MAQNLLQLNQPQSLNLNQQAFNNWQTSLNNAAEIAHNLNPSTLAGMALGQALGTWGGWRAGHMYQNWLADQAAKLEEAKRLEQMRIQGEKNLAADKQSVQNQMYWARQNGIQNPQPVSLFNLQNSVVDFQQPYKLNSEVKFANQPNFLQNNMNNFSQQMTEKMYPFNKVYISDFVKKYTSPNPQSYFGELNINPPQNYFPTFKIGR